MAVSISKLLYEDSGISHGTGSFTTAGITVPNNCVLVVHITAQTNKGSLDVSASLTLTDSIGGASWDSRTTQGNAGFWAFAARTFTKQFVTGGAGMTLTVDCGTSDIYQYQVCCIAVTGHNTSSPVGATASNGNFGTDGPQSLTLSDTPAATSAMVAFLWRDCHPNSIFVSEGSGWTEEYDGNYSGMSLQCQTYVGLSSTTVPWQDITTGTGVYKSGASAIEIKAAGAASSTPTLKRRLNILLRLCLSTFNLIWRCFK